MHRTIALLLLSTLLAAAAWAQGADAPWQLVLLKPRLCGSCGIAEELLRRRGFVQTAELSGSNGSSISARVVRRPSSELTTEEAQEIAALPYIDVNVWNQHARQGAAQVLLKRDGHVAAAGNIADSGDLRRLEFPEPVMAPRDGADLFELRAQHDASYSENFLRSWNLDYFYELTLNPRLRDRYSFASYLSSLPARSGPSLAPSNLVLMSTASWPGNNEIFNAIRIGEIQDIAHAQLGITPERTTVLYGGSNPTAANAVAVSRNRVALVRQPVAGSRPATLDNVARFFQQLAKQPRSRNLFVFVGHGGPDGAGLWNQLAELGPDDLATLHATGQGDDVLVSGNCFGGVMARSMSCGFFAARPDIIATGCQADAADVAQSRDYLKVFFSSLEPQEKARADANRDGRISFDEAHFFASTWGDTRNVTYTTLDALADAWFAAHPDTLPATLTIGELRKLADAAAPAEKQAVARITDGLRVDNSVSLANLAQQANEWSLQQAGVRPMLAQLTRRLLYVQRHAEEPRVGEVRACESRDIAAFLAP